MMKTKKSATKKKATAKDAKPAPEFVTCGPMLIEIAPPAKAKTAKKKATPAPAEKLSQLAAAERVLADAGEPMTCKAMVEAMTAKGLWSSPGGKTPEATLYSSILRNLRAEEPRFKKVARGQFALAATKGGRE